MASLTSECDTKNRPRISAVVRTFNSERTLPSVLECIQQQDLSIGDIVVVDSGSRDATLDVARRYLCTLVQYPNDIPFNYSRALNIGISAARGNLILIVSSHVKMVYRDILSFMVAHLQHACAAGVYCRYVKNELSLENEDDPFRGRIIQVNCEETFDGYNGLSNSCALIRRDCWEVMQFDETIPSCEDQAWALAVYRDFKMPTVRIQNAGVLYLNPRGTLAKECRDRAVIASRLVPSLGTWRAIFGHFLSGGSRLLRWRWAAGWREIAMGAYLTRWKLFGVEFSSTY